MRYWLAGILLLFLIFSFGQNRYSKLDADIKKAIKGFNGEIGYYMEDLKTGETISLNADSVFPTASIIKVPILVGVMDKIQQGALNYHQKLIYRDSLLYEGEDILGSFKDSESIELSKVIMLMLTTSDNTASLWLQSLAGTGIRINEIMESLGLEHTRVNSRTPGREEFRTMYGWGQTTPREMAGLFKLIRSGKVINLVSSEKMIRLLGRNYWDEEGLSAIPAGVFVASKNGAVNTSRSEVMLVNGKHPYIFSIFTKNIADQSWERENEAWVLTRRLAEMVWDAWGK